MHAIYSFATRYYSQEVHDSLLDIWTRCVFSNITFRPDDEITREDFLRNFDGAEEDKMLEIEVEDFEDLEGDLNELLVKHKIPFERMFYPYDGYTGQRTVFYPDSTSFVEQVDDDGDCVIPYLAFDHFFVKDTKMVSTSKLTANNFFKIIDNNSLKFKRRANYYINNEYIFIEPEKRKSIEDVLTEFDKGTITKEDAFSQIADIKKEGETIE